MTDMVGKILHNRYKILRPVGVGGMAEVYLAQDMLLDREVAVKILRAQFNNDKSLLEQFRREAQSAARLISLQLSIFLTFSKKTVCILSLWNT